MKHNVLKRALAGVLAVLCVTGYLPANVGTGGLFGGTELVAKADSAIPANGTNGYIVGNVISSSAEAGRMDIHNNSAAALFDNSDNKFCCCFSGEMTINFSYASSFVPKKYYIRTAGDTEDYYWRNMSKWRLQAKNANGKWVDLDVKDNSNDSLLPHENNEAVGFELNTTTAYKDYRLTGIKTFGFGDEEEHEYWDEYDELQFYDCIFQLSEIYFEEAADSRTNLSDATVTLANKKAIVSVNGNIVPETEYDLKFGTTVANASDTYPTSAGKYYAFAIAKNGSKDYRGIATRSFAVISNSKSTRYYAYDINTTHGRSQRPSLFFEGDYIEGGSTDYLTIYLDGEQILKDKKQRYTISKVCECVRDGYDESIYGHHEYIFYLESVPVPIWDASVTMQAGSPYVSSVVLNGKTLTLNKDYTITYKDSDGQVINDLLAYSGYCTAVITGTNSYIDSVEETFYLPPYSGPEWTWNADNTASAKFARTDGTDVQSKNATITSETTKNPTCENDGQIVYTAKVTFNDTEYTDTKTVDVSATGHTYGAPEWTWAEDYSTANAKFTCVKGDGEQTVEAVITSETTAATYTADGKIVYTASLTFGDTEYTDTKEVVIPMLTLVHHEAVAPTCTEDGTVEYWYDEAKNKYFSDANGEKEITEGATIILATGHNYGAPIWSWSNNGDGYAASMKTVCSKCGDVETHQATVTSTTADGIITYTATATVDGKEYTSVQQVNESYTFTVEDGTITAGEKESYSYSDAVTVKAEESKNGKYFSGWYVGDTRITTKQSYTFFVKSDMTVTANYEGDAVQEEQADVSVMITRNNIANDKQKVVFSLNWALPSGCKLKEAGIVRRYDNSSDLALANVDGSDIKKNASTLRTQNGNCNFNLTVSATTKLRSINAVAYAVYTDKNGTEKTVYSTVQTSVYNN